MYVIYPAEELFKIYESPIRSDSLNHRSLIISTSIDQQQQQQQESSQGSETIAAPIIVNCSSVDSNNKKKNRESNKKSDNTNNNNKGGRTKSVNSWRLLIFESKRVEVRSITNKRRRINSSNHPIMQNNRSNGEEGCSNPLKELTHATLNESLKQHNGNALKLVQTGECKG